MTSVLEPASAPPLLDVDGLTIAYRTELDDVLAVDDVSLAVARGEALGLVGESGCGKTTLANALMRLLPANARMSANRIALDGTDIRDTRDEWFRRSVRWKRVAMVFQGAMNALNPVEQVGRQMVRVAKLHGVGVDDARRRERVEELLRLVGLPPILDRYPHELSGGMRQRVIIALSLLADPEVIIADEATTALDVVVQAQILAELAKLQRERGLAMIVVSHDVEVIAQLCDRVAVMYAGRIVETGETARVLANPQHPYTAALLASLPRLTGPRTRLATLAGAPPEPRAGLRGCRFAPRCPLATDLCRTVEPELLPAPSGDLARCHFAGTPAVTALMSQVSK